MMTSVNIHRARTTNSLSTGSPERKRRIDFVFNFNQSIEEHWSTFLRVYIVGHIFRFVSGIIWIGPVDVESLHVCFFLLCKTLIKLFSVVNFEHICYICKTWLYLFGRKESCLAKNTLPASKSSKVIFEFEHILFFY